MRTNVSEPGKVFVLPSKQHKKALQNAKAVLEEIAFLERDNERGLFQKAASASALITDILAELMEPQEGSVEDGNTD